MNKKILILLAAFVLVLAGGSALYARLTAQPQQSAEPAPTAYEAAVTLVPQTDEAGETPAPQQEKKAEVAGPQMREDLAPVFTVYTDDGTSVRLSDMRGKPTVVNFFASWCGPCQMEMPYFEEAYKTYGEEINFMMVNLCAFGNDTKDNAKAMVEKGGWTFPVYFDTEGEAAIAYAVRSMPTTIFVSADGELIGKQIGALSQQALAQQIDSLLASAQ